MKLIHDKIIQQILRPVGKKVTFKYPGKEGHKKGYLKDRVVLASNPPYWDVVDLIEFPDEPEPMWLRIGYYRKLKDRLVFAGQTTITEPVRIWKELLVHAAREKFWFRDLLKEVMEELEKRC